MIYCVVPEALEGELLQKLTDYYASDENVQVIVDRRRQERRTATSEQDRDGQQPRELRDRRRQRITGEFPPLDQG